MSDEKIAVEILIEDKFSEAFKKMDEGFKKTADGLAKLDDQTKKNNSTMSNFAAGAVSAASAFAGFSVMKGFIADFQSAEMAQNKLNKAFENSKGIGITKKELTELGKTLEDKTLFSGEAIASVQSKLIAFKNIGGESFTRATALALDFATATGQDASAGATMLGKALANPAEGLSALKKAGVDFNTEQELMIQKMVRNGQVQEAQKFILDEVEKRYKGQAEAQVQGAGALALMTHKFSQLSEEIGKNLFGFIDPFVKFINEQMMPVLMSWGGEIAKIIGIIGLLVMAINGVSLAMSLLTKSNLILLAISAAVYGVITAFQNWDTIVEWVGINFQKLKLHALEVVRVMSNFVPALMPFKDKFDQMIEDAKKKVGELEKEKADKAEKRRNDELAKEKAATEKENTEKAKSAKEYQEVLKGLNAQGKKDEQLKNRESARQAFQKKLEEYDSLDDLDKKFLKQQDSRAKTEKTKKLKLEREAYNMLTKEDKDYFDDKAKATMIHDNQEMKKEQTKFRRKQTLMKTMTEKEADYVISQEQKQVDKEEEMANKKKAIEMNVGNARFEMAQTFFSQMGQLQQVKSKEAFEIAKAANIATAIMNAYTGISETLKTYPFPLSAAMAAAQGAIAFAQVSNIASQSPAFEDGGIMGGNSYTGDAMTARVNSREMVLTLDQQKNMLDILNKGGNVSNDKNQSTVVYNVKMYGVGTEKNMKKMMEQTIQNTEKRKLQKQQFVRGRFAT